MTMRNRKTMIVAFILVAALLMAVGFAEMSDDLYITGTAKITADNAEDAFADDIRFTKAIMSAEAGTPRIENDDAGGVNDRVVISVADDALKGKGDYVICTVEISNLGDLDAWVTLDSMSPTNTQYFSVTTTNAGMDCRALPAGGTIDFTVTITCIKTPQSEQTTDINITFTAYDYDPTAVTPNEP